jgi:hypothetical protein
MDARVSGQLLAAAEVVQPDYQSRKRVALGKVCELVGREVTIKSGRDEIQCTVDCDHDPPPEDCLAHNYNNIPLGLKHFVVSNYQRQ